MNSILQVFLSVNSINKVRLARMPPRKKCSHVHVEVNLLDQRVRTRSLPASPFSYFKENLFIESKFQPNVTLNELKTLLKESRVQFNIVQSFSDGPSSSSSGALHECGKYAAPALDILFSKDMKPSSGYNCTIETDSGAIIDATVTAAWLSKIGAMKKKENENEKEPTAQQPHPTHTQTPTHTHKRSRDAIEGDGENKPINGDLALEPALRSRMRDGKRARSVDVDANADQGQESEYDHEHDREPRRKFEFVTTLIPTDNVSIGSGGGGDGGKQQQFHEASFNSVTSPEHDHEYDREIDSPIAITAAIPSEKGAKSTSTSHSSTSNKETKTKDKTKKMKRAQLFSQSDEHADTDVPPAIDLFDVQQTLLVSMDAKAKGVGVGDTRIVQSGRAKKKKEKEEEEESKSATHYHSHGVPLSPETKARSRYRAGVDSKVSFPAPNKKEEGEGETSVVTLEPGFGGPSHGYTFSKAGKNESPLFPVKDTSHLPPPSTSLLSRRRHPDCDSCMRLALDKGGVGVGGGVATRTRSHFHSHGHGHMKGKASKHSHSHSLQQKKMKNEEEKEEKEGEGDDLPAVQALARVEREIDELLEAHCRKRKRERSGNGRGNVDCGEGEGDGKGKKMKGKAKSKAGILDLNLEDKDRRFIARTENATMTSFKIHNHAAPLSPISTAQSALTGVYRESESNYDSEVKGEQRGKGKRKWEGEMKGKENVPMAININSKHATDGGVRKNTHKNSHTHDALDLECGDFLLDSSSRMRMEGKGPHGTGSGNGNVSLREEFEQQMREAQGRTWLESRSALAAVQGYPTGHIPPAIPREAEAETRTRPSASKPDVYLTHGNPAWNPDIGLRYV